MTDAAEAPAPGRADRYGPGLRAGLGFAAAALVVGISFGVVAEPVMGSVAPIVMSALVFAGASQFGATAVLASGGGAATAIATAAMLNARFLPMGVAAASALRGRRLRRALEGQAVVDASWALAARGDGAFDREALLGATLPQYPAWVAGTAIGVLFGGALGDPEALGLDAIFPAFFLGLLAAELQRPRAVAAVLIAGAIALALTPLLPPGLPVLLASSAALIGLWRR
ncbi:MAG: AzlC family ABC transporter permease [Thermoleophilaceae bacterium]|nr:AzlC family ABC transporter permease [Thermoleophilaceae bacterium]